MGDDGPIAGAEQLRWRSDECIGAVSMWLQHIFLLFCVAFDVAHALKSHTHSTAHSAFCIECARWMWLSIRWQKSAFCARLACHQKLNHRAQYAMLKWWWNGRKQKRPCHAIVLLCVFVKSHNNQWAPAGLRRDSFVPHKKHGVLHPRHTTHSPSAIVGYTFSIHGIRGLWARSHGMG